MLKANFSSRLFLASVLLPLAVTGCHRTDLQKSVSTPVAAVAPGAALKEIHVDQRCQILKEHGEGVGNLKMDPAICHLDYVHTSHHLEQAAKDGVTQNNIVTIAEQEYLLQDMTAEPVIFVVEQFVPKGWQVGSDPQPTEMVGSTALFRVTAQPGQIVRLHVGERHTLPCLCRRVRSAANFER